MPRPKRVAIAGAGIGGLTAAVALKQAGHEVRVYERAPALDVVGAGIAIQVNALRALRCVGLDQRVIEAGVPITRLEIRSASGRLLSAAPLEALARECGYPNVALHRARLQAVLLEAFGHDGLTLGRAAVAYAQDAAGARLTLEGGEEVEADLVIGADGVHSALRAQMRPNDAPMRYAGYTAWRGLAAAADRVEPAYSCESWGRGLRFGYAPIGTGLVYWFAVANAPAGEADPQGHREAVLRRFERFHDPVPALVAATDERSILKTDLYDRDPVDAWSDGRIVLLGDAIHPMTPNLGQGGGQAIEDAIVLARALNREDQVELAIADYQQRRSARVWSLVAASRRIGEVGQLENPILVALRDAVIRVTPQSALLRQLRAAAAFQP